MPDALIRRILCCVAALVLLAQWPVRAAQPAPEYKLKAAFVYNFALFTDWPAGALADGAGFNICINADSPLRAEFSELGQKSVKGRRVMVHALTAPDAWRVCQVWFLDSLDRERWPQIRKSLAASSVLTVSDDEEIAREGVVIGLALQDKRMVFDVDTQAARQARLVLSSKLLRLARSVQ